MPLDTGGFGPLVDKLRTMPCVEMGCYRPMTRWWSVTPRPRSRRTRDDAQCRARACAFLSRTVHYMWCGLPVTNAEFSEVASYIRDRGGGWLAVPHDQSGTTEVIVGILANPDEARRGENAQRLARAFSWDRTIDSPSTSLSGPTVYSQRARSTVRAKKKSGDTQGRHS